MTPGSSSRGPAHDGGLLGLLSRFAEIRADEVRAVAASFAYFFAVLCAYYIIRPIRDEMGVTIGPDGLKTLFGVVFFVMLAAVPVFGWVVATFPKQRIVPVVYLFFIANILIFWLLFRADVKGAWIASTFFVWTSVFNLFVVSLFWSLMSDVYDSGAAKRLYGLIAAGGSAGAFTGPLLTQSLVHAVGPTNLLLLSAAILGAALAFARRLAHSGAAAAAATDPGRDRPAKSGIFSGAVNVWHQPYLFNIALWVLLANLISTYFYLEQARIVGEAIPSRADRVQLFARMDLAVSVLTVTTQVFLTAAVMKRFGVGVAISALPASATAGLIAFAIHPVLAVVVVVMVIERAITFALTNPGMRVLYTVVEPDDKYKAQNFIDTVVFRGGDAASPWVFGYLGKAGLGLAGATIAMVTVPFALAWLALSFMLGRQQGDASTRRPAT